MAVTVTVPASTATARDANDWYAFAPGATSATCFDPYGVSSVIASGTVSSFAARTATNTLPAMHRVSAVMVTAIGSASSSTTRKWPKDAGAPVSADAPRGKRPPLASAAGALVTLSSHGGRGARSALSLEHGPRLAEASAALVRAVRAGTLGKIVVQRVDGVAAQAGAGTARTPADDAVRALLDAGFRATPRGLRAA